MPKGIYQHKPKLFDKVKYQKQYHINNKKRENERSKQYRIDNPEYDKSYKHRFTSYKCGAKTKGLILEITFDEFVKIVNKPCHYCGGEGYGIDRLDNTVGYLKNNIVSCCSMCNFMKQKYTEEDFIKQCIKIANNKEVI